MATKQFCDVCGKEMQGRGLSFPGDGLMTHPVLGVYKSSALLGVFYPDICWPCVRDAIDKAYPRGEK